MEWSQCHPKLEFIKISETSDHREVAVSLTYDAHPDELSRVSGCARRPLPCELLRAPAHLRQARSSESQRNYRYCSTEPLETPLSEIGAIEMAKGGEFFAIS